MTENKHTDLAFNHQLVIEGIGTQEPMEIYPSERSLQNIQDSPLLSSPNSQAYTILNLKETALKNDAVAKQRKLSLNTSLKCKT